MPENCEIELVCAGGLWPCEVDPGQLQNALVNLVVNACDAMPQGGKITIETANAHLDGAYAAAHIEVDPGQYVMLAVSDTGPGMTEEVMARAFEPFFTTKRAGAGSGLGLSMVYGFTKQSRGHIKLYSELGHGTTVKIYLPRGQAKPATDVAAETAVEKADEEETVLLVEDDADVRALAAEQLKSLGYQVLEAPNADAALAIIREGKPIALLFTDVVLPGGMNGRALADQVKHILPQMKVLYMSGYTENAIIHHGRLDPGVFLLQKPFRRHDLAAKVRAAIVGARR
jgi:CheY-like chemotaxis protein